MPTHPIAEKTTVTNAGNLQVCGGAGVSKWIFLVQFWITAAAKHAHSLIYRAVAFLGNSGYIKHLERFLCVK